MSPDAAVTAVNEYLMGTHLGYDDCTDMAEEIVAIVRAADAASPLGPVGPIGHADPS